jgi:hypothetical protein
MPLRLAGFRFQQVIAHVGARDVDIAADEFEQPRAQEKSSRIRSFEF